MKIPGFTNPHFRSTQEGATNPTFLWATVWIVAIQSLAAAWGCVAFSYFRVPGLYYRPAGAVGIYGHLSE